VLAHVVGQDRLIFGIAKSVSPLISIVLPPPGRL
jgi:hypothetical protein